MKFDRKTINTILLLIVFASLVFWCGQYLFVIIGGLLTFLSIFMPLFIGFAVAFVLNVFLISVERAWDKLIKDNKYSRKLKRPISLLITYLVVAIAIFVLLFMVVPEISRTISNIIDELPTYMKTLETNVTRLLDKYDFPISDINSLKLDWEKITSSITDFLSNGSGSFFNSTFSFASSILSGALSLVLGIVFSIYMLLQKEKFNHQAHLITKAYLKPELNDKINHVSSVAYRIFSKFVTGQLLEAFIIGMLCFIGMNILRLPYALMISTLVGFTALIPVVGAFIGTGVGAFLILLINPMQALAFIVFILILQQFEGNLIYPRVVGKSVGLPGIWVLAAVTFGGSLGGITGMLIAVPLSSVLYILLKEDVAKKVRNK